MMKQRKWVRLLLIVFVIVLSVLFFLKRAHLGMPGTCTMANAYDADCQEMLAGNNIVAPRSLCYRRPHVIVVYYEDVQRS